MSLNEFNESRPLKDVMVFILNCFYNWAHPSFFLELFLSYGLWQIMVFMTMRQKRRKKKYISFNRIIIRKSPAPTTSGSWGMRSAAVLQPLPSYIICLNGLATGEVKSRLTALFRGSNLRPGSGFKTHSYTLGKRQGKPPTFRCSSIALFVRWLLF